MCPVFACYTLAFTSQPRERKTRKNLSQGSQNVPVGMIQCFDIFVFFGKLGDVDTDIHILGEPGERSVGVDICRAVLSLFFCPLVLDAANYRARNYSAVMPVD